MSQATADSLPITQEFYDLLCECIRRDAPGASEILFSAIVRAGSTEARAVCTHGAATYIYPAERGDVPIPGNNTLLLDRMYHFAKFANDRGVRMLAGQCQECGRVHWVLVAPGGA